MVFFVVVVLVCFVVCFFFFFLGGGGGGGGLAPALPIIKNVSAPTSKMFALNVDV